MRARESFFVCRFTSPRGNRTAHVRAWDEREAVQVFREELVEEDLRERGTIEVISARDRRRLQTSFDPAAAH
jgi:hypothetical protein